MELEESNEYVDYEEDEAEEQFLQERSTKHVWSDESSRDRLIGKMLRLVSQFVVKRLDNSNDDQGTMNYVRGNKAVIHTNEFLKLVDANENYETRVLMIQFIKFKGLDKYKPIFESCAQFDDEVLARNCLSLCILLTKPIESKLLQILASKKNKKEDKEATFIEKKYFKDNIGQQVSCLLEIKEAMISESILSTILWLVEKPLKNHFLEKKWSESESIAMERFFLFLRNILAINVSPLSTAFEISKSKSIHNHFITYLSSEFINILATTTASLGQERYFEWIKLHVQIIFHLTRGHDAKTLFSIIKQYTSNKINFKSSSMSENNENLQNRSMNNNNSNKTNKTSGLLGKIKADKNKRAAAVSSQPRFGGIYRAQTTLGASRVSEEPSSDYQEALPSQLVRNPTASFIDMIPQVKRKRQKQNVTFTSDDNKLNTLQISSDLHKEPAGVIVALFIDNLVKHGFKELAYAVKIVWHRGSQQMGPEDDLVYYQIASLIVRYRRYQLQEEMSPSNNPASSKYVPDIKVLLLIMDRITINRAFSNIESLKIAKSFDQIVYPMELFKEIIASTNIFLNSSDLKHHEIAIGTLNRIFYTAVSNERLDPIPTLLRDWKPGTYGKRHLDILIETVHETFKTLDAAKRLFNSSYGEESNKRGSSLIQQFIAAALRFDPDEYFRRLVTPNTISLYTRVLDNFDSNTPQINHYVQCFLQRVCLQTLEIDSGTYNSISRSENDLNLSYMFFNMETISVFTKILNSSNISSKLDHLIRLIKSIIRSLGKLSERNHLIFVEMLLHHPHAQHFCQTIETVYDAEQFVTAATASARDRSDSEASDDDNDDDDEAASVVSKTVPDNYEYGDEFDETALPESFTAAPKAKTTKKKKKKERRDIRPKYDSGAETNSDWDSETENLRISRTSRKKSKKVASWSAEEDQIIKEKIEIYSGSRSLYENIAQDQLLSSHGRTALDVEKRVKDLKLSQPVPRKPVVEYAKKNDNNSMGQSNGSELNTEKSFWDDTGNSDDDDRWTGNRFGAIKSSTTAPLTTRVETSTSSENRSKLIKKRLINDDDDEDEDNDDFFRSVETKTFSKVSAIIDSDDD